MTDHTVVFISGVSRGIGKALAAAYLSRPNHRVIGSIRDSSPPEGVEELKLSPTASESSLMLVKIESTNPEDPERVLQEMIAAGVDHLDIVISNAGGSPVPPTPLGSVAAEELSSVYHTNVIGPLRLFQVFKPLLQKSKTPKWIWQSSIGGSITSMAQTSSWIAPAYGASRAASNWIASALHFTNEWLIVVPIYPGLVQTPSGNWVAQQIGMEKAPISMELCVERIISLADGATRDKVSGKFISSVEGTELPW
ncbi:aflatoxin biosynthesis ketoreductase nor-1 [Xylaria sp. FL1042]|nr:aflatoxin biosynthesis ketoreductase nor-1 [Xylaria sp. FL1042]